MASRVIPRKWLMRMAFAALCLALIFLQLLPLETTPRRWAGPDLLVVLTVACAVRQPDFTPPALVGAVFLLADLLLMRPPGLMAAVMVVATEFQRRRALSMRDATFLSDWAMAAGVMVSIALVDRLVLALFLVERSALGLTLMQVMMNLAVYPLVVLLSQALLGVRKTRAREAGLGAGS